MKQFRGKGGLLLMLTLCLSLLSGCMTEDSDTAVGSTTGKKVTGTRAQGSIGTNSATSPAEVPAPEDGPAKWEKYPEGSLVARRTLGSVSSLDPHRADISTEEELARYLYGSLYMLVGNGESRLPEYAAYHAADLPKEQGALRYTIELKHGLSWSDGQPLTSEDYVYSLKMLLDPSLDHTAGRRFTAALPIVNGRSYQEGQVSDFQDVGFKAAGENTLEISLEYPRTSLDVSKAFSQPFAVHQDSYEKSIENGRSTYGDKWEELVFAGPYTIADYEAGDHVWLEKRRDPASNDSDSEYFTSDYISFRKVPDRMKAMEAFQEGRLDLISVAGGAYSHVKEDPRLKETPSNTIWGLYVNTRDPKASILEDPDFRKALYYGIDRTKIAVSMFGSHSSYSSFIGPLTYVQAVKEERVKGDPGPAGDGDTSGSGPLLTVPVKTALSWELINYRSTPQSKELVPAANVYEEKRALRHAEKASAGLSQPQTLEITVPDGGQFDDMAEHLALSIGRLFNKEHIEVTIRKLPLAECYAAYLAGDYELGFGAMGQDLFDPLATLSVYTGQYPEKFNTFSNPRFDELYEKAYEGQFFRDHNAYMALLKEMEEILLEELPMIPVFADHGAWLLNAELVLPFEEPVPGAGLELDRARRLNGAGQ